MATENWLFTLATTKTFKNYKKELLRTNKKILLSFFFLFFWIFCFSQIQKNQGDLYAVDSSQVFLENTKITKSPTKAALYSAILPGLGQVYNKKYTKAPLVLAVLGTGIGFVAHYQNESQRYRTAFLSELNGENHEFSDLGLSAESLAQSQVDLRRFRDYAIVLTTLAYLLNIVDAAVDAHLFDAKNDPDLKIISSIIENPRGELNPTIGLKFRF